MVRLTGATPSFDMALLARAFDDPREAIRVQLSRWMTQGKVVALRCGMYALSETYHLPAVREDVSPFLERPQDAALLTHENLEGLL